MVEQAQEEIQAVKCPKCGAVCPKAGKRPDGVQRYRCSLCGKTFSEHKQQENVFATKQAVDDTKALLTLQLLVEGNSIRSAERITGINRNTIMVLLMKAGERCTALLQSKIRNVAVADVQCDEIWTFVRKKRGSRWGGEPDYAYIGDAWTFIAIERNTKLVLTHLLGQRTVRSTMQFIKKIADVTDPNKTFQLTTDGMRHYAYAVGMLLEGRVDMRSSSRSTKRRPSKSAAATARRGSRRRTKRTCMATQISTSYALHTSSARTDRCASGASA